LRARARREPRDGATLGVPPAGARRSSASRSSSAQRENHACFDLAEPVPGPTTDALGRVARETRAVVIASLFERRAGA